MAGLALNVGDLLMLGNVVLWSLYSVLARIVTRARSVISATAFSTWLALPFLYPAMLLEWQSAPPPLAPALGLTLLYIGVFPAFVAFLAWNEGVRRVGPIGSDGVLQHAAGLRRAVRRALPGETLGAGQIAAARW